MTWIHIAPIADRYRAIVKHDDTVVFVSHMHRTPARARAEAKAWLSTLVID
jgi:hypothetical protein